MSLKAISFLLVFFCAIARSSKLSPDGHLKPIGHSGPNHAVFSAEGFLKPAIFVDEYLRKSKPVIMRGAVKDFPAFHKWTDAYLRSRTPEGSDGDVFVEQGKKENRSDPSGDMHFVKFLDTYNDSDIYMVHHVPAFLSSDVVMPFCIQCDSFNKSFADTVMWFSSGGTKSVFHNDAFENINCLFRGKKRLVMANVTQYAEQVSTILDGPGYSYVDVEKVDLQKYPIFIGMDFHVVEMNPGDCLYIPFGWMHHVASTGSNLAVNIWFKSEGVDVSTCRSKMDLSLTLDKFTYSEKDEDGERVEFQPNKTKSADKEESKGDGLTVDTAIEAIADIVMPNKDSVSRSTFILKMTEGKALETEEKKLAVNMFKLLDSNRNGKFDMVDFDTKMSPKFESLFLKIMRKWEKVAQKYHLAYINLLSPERGSPARMSLRAEAMRSQEPRMDAKIYDSLSDRDEL